MTKKPLGFIEEEIGVEEIDGACEAVNHLSAVCGSLKLQIDNGTLDERQQTIRLYNRTARLQQSALALRDAIRVRWREQQKAKGESYAGTNAYTLARAREDQEDSVL